MATRRCTGAAWSATQTSPMPPSPSFWRSLKRPAKTRSGKSGGPSCPGASVGPASGPRSRMPAVWPSASSRRSMRRRRASSPPHAPSRNAHRSAPGALLKAAAKIDSSLIAPDLHRCLLAARRLGFCQQFFRFAQEARSPGVLAQSADPSSAPVGAGAWPRLPWRGRAAGASWRGRRGPWGESLCL